MRTVVLACFSMALAVSLGAMAAHALRDTLSVSSLESFQTGVRYQIYHSLAILLIVALGRMFGVRVKGPIRLMGVGMIMFSFSIYLLSTRDVTALEEFGPYIGWVTPLGGILLIASWVWTAIVFARRSTDAS